MKNDVRSFVPLLVRSLTCAAEDALRHIEVAVQPGKPIAQRAGVMKCQIQLVLVGLTVVFAQSFIPVPHCFHAIAKDASEEVFHFTHDYALLPWINQCRSNAAVFS